MSRSFIDKLLSGATRRTSEMNVIDPGPPPEMLAPPDPVPHDYVKARTLLQTSIDKLFSRQAVLMREIAVRQGELFETNKTLEALAGAATAIHDEHEPEIDEDALARALSEGDAGVYENPIVSMTEEEYVDYRAKATSLLREATAAPITADTPFPSGAFKPRGFA